MRTDPLVGRTVAGYRLVELIGRGGMGVVYRAEQLSLGRDVAFKLLREDLAHDEAFRTRFLRESRLGGQVPHPNMVPIYDAGEADGLLYIAMQHVDGVDLRRLVARDGRLAPPRALAILAPVARALDAAHARGLVHRDVKPANILVVEHGGGGAGGVDAYLSDFGLLKRIASQTGLTQAGKLVGTMAYVAPEQIQGQPVSGAADQYALACVLFECLTGSMPFPREEEAAVLWAHLSSPPPSLADRRPDLPAGLGAVLARAMAKQPSERFGSCHAFLDAAGTALGAGATTVHSAAATTGPGAADATDPATVIDRPAPADGGGPQGGPHDQRTRTATVPAPPRWSAPAGGPPAARGLRPPGLVAVLAVLGVLVMVAVASAGGDGGQAGTATTLPATSPTFTTVAPDTTIEEIVTTEPEPPEPTTTTQPQPPKSLRLPFTLKGRGTMQLPPFTAAGSWHLAWSYDCRKAEYSTGFDLEVAPGGESVMKFGTSQSGAETYRAGTSQIRVRPSDEACRWSLRATGTPGAPNRRVPFTLNGSGSTTTAPFTVHGGWDIAWSYRCSDELFGDFEVNVHPGLEYAIHDFDGKGSGVEHFDTGGTYFLVVAPGSGCSWTLKVTG